MKKFKFNYLAIIILALGSVSICNAQSRKIKTLNDGWKFTLVDKEIEYVSLSNNSWNDVNIPHTWNDKDIQSGDKVHYGTGW
jgi:beta-galactosidase